MKKNRNLKILIPAIGVLLTLLFALCLSLPAMADDEEYEMTEAPTEWVCNRDGNAYFKTNGPYELFTGVKIDGAELSTLYYDTFGADWGEEYTYVVLFADYLNFIGVGQHTISICYSNGLNVEAAFSIVHECDGPLHYIVHGYGKHELMCDDGFVHSEEDCTDEDGNLCTESGQVCIKCGWEQKCGEQYQYMITEVPLCIKGQTDDAYFKAYGSYGLFAGVKIDGAEISTNYYDAYGTDWDEEYTYVALHADYLDLLSPDQYTISICYGNEYEFETSGVFTVFVSNDVSYTYTGSQSGRHFIECSGTNNYQGEEYCTDEDGNLCMYSGKVCMKCGFDPKDEGWYIVGMPAPGSNGTTPGDQAGTSDETSTQEQTESATSTSTETTTETTTAAATTAPTATSASTATQAATTNRTSTATTSDTVKTGYRSNASLYIIMALVAAGIGGFVIRKLVHLR